MPKERFLNIELRSFVLHHAIRQEELTAEILKLVFKILKNNPKTFGNTGSSISFQNKIDFLFDLGDIKENDYSHFKKLLEIRNQFAHNPKCISFKALQTEKPEYIKHLHKHFLNEEQNIEEKTLKSYISLFKYCHKILCLIRKSYLAKYYIEIERYQCYVLLQVKFFDWVSQAREDFEKKWEEYNLQDLPIKNDKINFFVLTLDAFKHKLFADIIMEENDIEKLVTKILNIEKK